ncbi:NUDIX hydrolase [Alkalibacillus aidingensis]|uniref:NUDIX hydrolase n=1 Tax=Alkalibacillus aidingensis TaxID=2747607 RepID=UPI001660F5BD|nr:NUDIX domain-containing protein [Alkalibacillus aidingensis]
MGEEQLKIFDREHNQIGVASRKEVHKQGLWHEAFHCWLIGKRAGQYDVYLQLRSQKKKDYPNLLDISAAGHLLANEAVEDGVREVKEEIGIDVSFEVLEPLGVINFTIEDGEFIDREFSHVFLYKSELSLEDLTIQPDEVAGMVKMSFGDFSELWFGKKERVKVDGFQITKDGRKYSICERVGIDDFVPHHMDFYREVVRRIEKNLD